MNKQKIESVSKYQKEDYLEARNFFNSWAYPNTDNLKNYDIGRYIPLSSSYKFNFITEALECAEKLIESYKKDHFIILRHSIKDLKEDKRKIYDPAIEIMRDCDDLYLSYADKYEKIFNNAKEKDYISFQSLGDILNDEDHVEMFSRFMREYIFQNFKQKEPSLLVMEMRQLLE